MEMGRLAMERHHQRHPHALPSLSRMARLLEQAFDFKKLALGLDSPNPLPEKITYGDDWPDLKRAYGHRDNPPTDVKIVPGNAAASTPAPVKVAPSDPKPPPPTWPPPETKRDITPVKLVIGPHGLLMYEYPAPASGS